MTQKPSIWLTAVVTPAFLAGMLCVSYRVNPEILHFRPNGYALFSLVAFLANLSLLAYMMRVRAKVGATHWYILYLICLVVWTGSEFFQRLSAEPQGALFWSTLASVGWVALSPMLFMFSLAFVRKDGWQANQGLYRFLILTTIGFLYLNLTTDAFTPSVAGQLTAEPWGYNSGVEAYFPFFLVWFESLYILSVWVLYRHIRETSRPDQRRQLALLIGGVLVPLIGGSITDGILPIFGFNVYPMAVTLSTVTSVCIAIAILRYGLLVFNPAAVADNVLETLDEGVVVLGANLVIQYANTRAEEMLGYSQDGLLDCSLDQLFPSAYMELRHSLFGSLVAQRFGHLEKIDISKADGSVLPVSISAARVTNIRNDIEGYILTLTDVSQLQDSLTSLKGKIAQIRRQNRDLEELGRQLAEEKASVSRQVEDRTRELKESRVQLMASINSLQQGFVMLDTELRVVLMNESVIRLLTTLERSGRKGRLKPSDTLADLDHAFRSKTGLEEAAQECLKESASREVKDLTVGGSHFNVYISPIMLSRKPIGAVLLVQDVTEERVLDRSKDEFFSIASHELRTPLTAILGYSALIKSLYVDKEADERLAKMVAGINEGGERMVRIVNDFLSMSRLEQGKLIFQVAPMNMAELTEEAIRETEPLAHKKGVKLLLQAGSHGVPLVCGDRDRVKQVLINLIGNAIKFTSHGRIVVSLEAEGGDVRVRVHDTGSGIPLDNQSLLFRKFQQAGSSLIARDDSSGTGLGLYISKLLVEGMGGEIGLESSAPGQGSTFSFTLPLAGAE